MLELKVYHARVRPGQQVRVDIPIAFLPSHTLIDLPVFVWRGKEDGPVMLLSGGLHGDEINGIDIVKRLLVDESIMPNRGTVLAMPVVNVYGFINNSRTFPDGRDLNRSFPGASKGSLAAQIAHILTTEIIPIIDFGVDFHTGGSRLSNYPQLRVDKKDKKGMEYAKAFGSPFIINSAMIDKSFRKEAYKQKKSILVYEAGESLRLSEQAIKEGMEGVLNLMRYLGMISGEHKDRSSKYFSSSSWIRARVSGIFNANCQEGDFVKKGQVIARITDPYGTVKIPVKSTKEGYIIGQNNMPVVNAGDALFHIGVE
jgi:predicted deacylase